MKLFLFLRKLAVEKILPTNLAHNPRESAGKECTNEGLIFRGPLPYLQAYNKSHLKREKTKSIAV
ncbi:MAG: hypothetical protein LBR79_05975 [Oscillospiraceae bacterium]|nr:hypothetical protein [Oscillospiraceae bacterium]